MAFCEVRFRAESIAKTTGMNVILPGGPGPHPVLYLLHGLSDDHTNWHRNTSIERYAEGTGLIIVMPDGHRSFYVNDPRPGGLAYEDHIVRDVVAMVDNIFPTVRLRRGRAVAGLSMGGYGAMMLATRHPDVFSAASAHSSAMFFAHTEFADRPGVQALADALPAGQYDCFALAEKLKTAGPVPAIRFDCGTDDPLIEHNRAFHRHLGNLGIAHEYAEFPGGHNWAYWDEHIRDTLAFVGRCLKC